MNLGEEIRRYRKEKGVTATFVARKINKNLVWVTERERGKRDISVPDLLLISSALEVNPAIFLSKNFG